MRFFEKDLRRKITAILLLFLIVSLGSTALISYAFMNSVIRRDVDDSMLDAARLTRNMVEVSLERRKSRSELLVSFPVMRDPSSTTEEKRAALSLFVEAWPIGKGAVFLDTAGAVVCGTGKLESMGSAVGTDWFENAQTARIAFTYISEKEELTGAFFDEPVLAVSAPVRDAQQQIFGYVVNFTTMSDITRAVNSVTIEETGNAFIVDSRGVVVAGHLFDRHGEPSSQDMRKVEGLVVEMTGSGAGRATVVYGGREYLVTYTRVEQTGVRHPELDWAIGVAVPTSQAFAPAHFIAWVLFGLAAAFILAAGLAAVVLGRSISRPIDELVENAERVGSGDLTGEVAIRTRDQIGTLAAAFLRMRDYLRSALSEAARDSDRISMLAEEQSAATQDLFANTEEIVESVVVLARNMEAQTQKLRKIAEYAQMMPEQLKSSAEFGEVVKLMEEGEILAEVGAEKAVEIASATQEQRAATRDLAAAARRLSETASELRNMVQRFKV